MHNPHGRHWLLSVGVDRLSPYTERQEIPVSAVYIFHTLAFSAAMSLKNKIDGWPD